MAMPDCPECKIPALWASSPDRPCGEEGWCPRCGQAFASPDKPPSSLPPSSAPAAVPLLPGLAGIPYRLREMPAGHLELTTDDGGGPWRLSGVQARALGEALLHGATLVKVRGERMRGVDRWGLRRRGGQLFGCTGKEERRLVPFTVGRQRYAYSKGFTCNGCGAALLPGATGYKAEDLSWKGTVEWAHVRFCAACVDATQGTAERLGLRLVPGGSNPRKIVKCRAD